MERAQKEHDAREAHTGFSHTSRRQRNNRERLMIQATLSLCLQANRSRRTFFSIWHFCGLFSTRGGELDFFFPLEGRLVVGDRSVVFFLGGMNYCCFRSFVVLWHVLRFDWFSVPSFLLRLVPSSFRLWS